MRPSIWSTPFAWLSATSNAAMIFRACALIGEVRRPIKAEPGRIERYDCEYGCDPARDEVEQRIGEIVAAAAVAICARGLEAAGRLADTTRAQAGDLFVQLYWLQEEDRLGEIDFAAVAWAAQQVRRFRPVRRAL
jgi:hypothetical protein